MGFGDMILPGIGVASSILNMNNQREMNDLNWIRQAQMYQQQRADALADRDYMNVYNSPVEQMKRLKAAGLNPNLVYGSGSMASSASQMPRGASPGGPQGQAPQFNMGSILQAVMVGAQTANLGAKTALDQQKLLTEGWNTDLTRARSLISSANVPFASGIASAGLDLLKAKRDEAWSVTVLNELKQRLMNSTFDTDVQKNVQDLLIKKNILKLQDEQLDLLNKRIEGEGFRNEILQVHRDMWKKGINPSDPLYIRVIAGVIKKYLGIDLDLY